MQTPAPLRNPDACAAAKGKATGKSVRAAVTNVFEISDGKIVRFDQCVDSATINPIIGA